MERPGLKCRYKCLKEDMIYVHGAVVSHSAKNRPIYIYIVLQIGMRAVQDAVEVAFDTFFSGQTFGTGRGCLGIA